MKAKKSFSLCLDYWDWFKLLTDEEMGRLLRAIFCYERDGVEPDDSDEKLKIFFCMIKESLDRERKHHEAICNRNKENANLRWKKAKEQMS